MDDIDERDIMIVNSGGERVFFSNKKGKSTQVWVGDCGLPKKKDSDIVGLSMRGKSIWCRWSSLPQYGITVNRTDEPAKSKNGKANAKPPTRLVKVRELRMKTRYGTCW